MTCILGETGIGKSVILKRCLQTYFADNEQNIIKPYEISYFAHTNSLSNIENGIYVFEDFDEYHTLEKYNILNQIMKYQNDNTRFVIMSCEKIKYTNFINYIQILPFSKQETEFMLNGLNKSVKEYLINEFFNATSGKPLLIENIIQLLLYRKYSFDNISKIICKPCIIDKYGIPIDKVDNSTKIIITEVNEQLLYELAKNPESLHNLSSYDFERVIARIFEKQGFSVEITPRTRDGGKDIFVAKQGLASFLFYVECKKYAPNKPVGIDVIQRLYGVISAEKANGGFIATTSYFTKPAKDYIQEHLFEHQLTLQDTIQFQIF